VPEGGSNRFALPGVAEMVNELPPCQYVCTACGTGGTLAGILAGLQGRGMAIGVPVLKGGAFIKNEVEQLLQEAGYGQYSNFDLLTDYHFGGYAKTKPELLHFIEHFGQKHGIPLEPIYTGKMFFALFDAIEKGYFERGSTIVAVHTGGLRPTSW
jgi:1-aminocyclopropane-1-carboxylate deaminase/D-cysteine desulfhydrase-like pyridoxal-dependent ACC family enzyme